MTHLLVSIVIPVRQDAEALAQILEQLPPATDVQVVVSVGGLPSEAHERLRALRPDVHWVNAPVGRGVQLNAGAADATGRWLWFVHADSRLPSGWRACFETLETSPDVGGGSFMFRLDSSAWQARVLERGVALRVRLFGLPYGDQGIFVRRTVFHRLGGFAAWPLMEDVDFVRRLATTTGVRHLPVPLVTSARRWERDGWFRRSAGNLALLAGYAAGVSPQTLASYYDRGAVR